LASLYKSLKARNEDFEVVFCSMDRTEAEYRSYTDEMPWWSLPHKSPALGKLANLYGAVGIPHLVVLEKDGSVLHSDGIGEVSVDPEGKNFPWRPKKLVELLPASYIGQDKSEHSISDLNDKYLMLYFSAHWCPPCKQFTPKLSQAYTALKEHRDNFEVRDACRQHPPFSLPSNFIPRLKTIAAIR
jgi:nucleoredoxin